MSALRNPSLWAGFTALTIATAALLGYTMLSGDDKTFLMPGPLTAGHHQLADACDACHTDAFGGGEVLQEACKTCHGATRKKPFDSHPASKFTDPRNADRLARINALECVTCHVEHRPEITKVPAFTQPADFCAYCHSEIAKDRPSHEGMPFTSCRDSGCHNFHNNRALYTDFLLKHLHEPDVLETPQVPEREFGKVLDEIATYPHDRYPVRPLTTADADAGRAVDGAIEREWLETAHARSGVNCSACHVPADGDAAQWTDYPDHQACAGCHATEVERFGLGKHGMRLARGLSPMTPASALIPMKDDVNTRELRCTTCHPAHRFDTAAAAVDACLECHNDEHSRAYEGTPHHALWQRERSGEIAAGRGVSCATCHMPRIQYDVSEWLRRVTVDHNQNATLRPNEKMMRPACLHCHGLQFSLDALADRDLVRRNFDRAPGVHVRSLDMAAADEARHEREREAAGQ